MVVDITFLNGNGQPSLFLSASFSSLVHASRYARVILDLAVRDELASAELSGRCEPCVMHIFRHPLGEIVRPRFDSLPPDGGQDKYATPANALR